MKNFVATLHLKILFNQDFSTTESPFAIRDAVGHELNRLEAAKYH